MVGAEGAWATTGRGGAEAAGLAMVEVEAVGAADGGTGADGAPVGPPGGSVGSLMVGAAEGFGGKLMRTVSFLGCTLPVSFFGGGTAPVGMFGGSSAISLIFKINGDRLVSNVIGKNVGGGAGVWDAICIEMARGARP